MLDDDEEWGDCLDERLNGKINAKSQKIRISGEFAETQKRGRNGER